MFSILPQVVELYGHVFRKGHEDDSSLHSSAGSSSIEIVRVDSVRFFGLNAWDHDLSFALYVA